MEPVFDGKLSVTNEKYTGQPTFGAGPRGSATNTSLELFGCTALLPLMQWSVYSGE